MEKSEHMNYYEILNCQPTDSIDVIKKSYQALILKYHPDKQDSNSQHDDNIERFHEIDEAWKVLRDMEKRKQYDAETQQHRFNEVPIIHEKIYRNDFEFDSQTQIYSYPCRCGGLFVLPDEYQENALKSNSDRENELSDNEEIYIECDECSFVIQLLKE